MSDFRQILSQAKQQIKEVSPQEVRDKLNPANGFSLLDVREGDEWEQGHLDKAVFLPRGFLEQKADKMFPNKQHVFDDFIAASEWLIKAGYTIPQKLVINGVSNGGLLVGAALTQRPDLYRVVICRKPDLDMLRRHIAAHNVYATLEYGSDDKPDQFGFLYAAFLSLFQGIGKVDLVREQEA